METVGVGDEGRDSGSGEDVEWGDEDGETVWARLIVELFGA